MRFKPEYIVNFAAQGMVAESWNDPTHWYKTNIVSQVALHDELRKENLLKNMFMLLLLKFMEVPIKAG